MRSISLIAPIASTDLPESVSQPGSRSSHQYQPVLSEHIAPGRRRQRAASATTKVLPVAICLVLLAACGSDPDSVTLGNGLETQVGPENSADAETAGETQAETPSGFLSDAAPAEDNEAANAAPTAQAEIPASPGIGGAPQQQDQPLNDTPQSDTAPAGAEANPAGADETLDLSNDILIPPEAPTLTIAAGAGELVFTWESPVAEEQAEILSFEIDEYNSVTRESTNLVRDLESTVNSYRIPVIPHEFDWDKTEFVLSVCTENDCLRSFNTPVADLQSASTARVQSTGGNEFDLFGSALAVAANGKVLIAGKPGHDVVSDAAAESEGETAEGIYDAGAAELFFEVENEWFAAAKLDITNPEFNSQLGFAVAADGLGDTVVVGAPSDSSRVDLAGSAHVYIRLGETWVQSATLVAPQARAFARFGHSVAISDDGMLIAVGAPGDANSTIDPFAPIDTATDAGSVTLFRFEQTTGSWILSDYVRSPSIASGQKFGHAISLSEAADTLVVAAPGEQASEERAMPGVVHVFDIDNAGVFSRQQLLQLADSRQDPALSGFGSAIALSADGETVLVTCLNRPESGGEFSTQLNKPQTELVVYDLVNNDESGLDGFAEQQRLIPAGEHGFDSSLSVAITTDGSKIAAGLLNPTSESNTVTVFRRSEPAGNLSATATGWGMINSITQPDDALNFGTSVEFSSDGTRLFIAADGGADGGTVYVY